MLSLLYVSRSRLRRDEEERQLADIVAVAVSRNLRAGVTGALIHTPSSFAQLLEGPEGAVEDVMGSILVDPRHNDVHIVSRMPISERRFPNWGMVLVGRHAETQRHIDLVRAAGSEASLRKGVEGLTEWMEKEASARM